MNAAIELKNLTVTYPGGQQILNSCNFKLNYGQLAVMSGLSGEGKTTFLNAINGIIPHAVSADIQGDVLVDGQSIIGVKMAQVARKVGSVLQNPDSQIFHSRVDDEIAFGCENLNLPQEEIRRRVEETCALLSLEPDAPTRTLSGGQKQRLMAACVLAMGQKILLLDEPLANLDLAGSKLLLSVLKDLCAKGYAVLLAEHRLDIVAPYADRLFSLEGKGVKEIGREEASYSNTRKIADTAAGTPLGEPLITASNLAYSVRRAEILRDISLSVRKGERIVLLGENGCGKTTLLRLLAGLIKPSAGTISASIPARPGTRKWFRTVGYVYQEPSYQLFMPTVREELCHGAAEGWGERCLNDFGLMSLAERHPHSLSEGQKRRVSIAAVMATAAELILLDEPTVGQDFDNLEHMVSVLNEIHMETGNSMITITHDPRCAEALADRAVWIQDGRVFREGGKEIIESYFS
ncbi:MAG: ABC transporter ATP-binding protein [Christensenellales bacterium]